MTPQNGETRSWRDGQAAWRIKKKYRRWAVVYILLALLMAAVLVLLIVAGVYKTLVGVLCMVVVAADMAFLAAGSVYLRREEKR